MPISLRSAEQALVHAPEQDMVVLVSPPGTGKSSIVVRAAQRMNAVYTPVYAATMEAVDARGLPYPMEHESGHKVVKWAAPSFLPLQLLANQYPADRSFLVNFDDWFQAPPPVLRATVRSIYGDGHERRIGDFPILSRVRFVATGNREQDRAGVYRPETYVNDRITYIEVEPSYEDWVSGAISGFSPPEPDSSYAGTRKAINAAVAKGVPDELVAYVQMFKQCYEFSAEQRSFLSPRSIERLGRFVRAFDAAGINGDTLHEVACGTIGEAQATKYMAFHKLRGELPDIDGILKGDPAVLNALPTKSEILYIVCTTVLRTAKKEHTHNVAKFLDKLSRLEKAGMMVGVEVSAYLFRECLRGTGTALRGLRSEELALKWMQSNGKYFTE
jgi:hypothetical protein